MNSEALSKIIINGMEEKKASDIVLMDLREVKGAVSDFFIICSGNSDTQLQAIAESIEEEVEKNSDERPWRKEGYTNKEWILLDYVSVVAHIFKSEKRAFYALEELWGDAKITSIAEMA